MAWGSILSALRPPEGMLFVQRNTDPGFRFHIEPKTGKLWRTMSLGSLKEADFNVPQLDESLRLRTNSHAKAASYFSASEERQALVALLRAEFTQLKGDHGAIVATLKGISAESLSPERIDRYLEHLRSFGGDCRPPGGTDTPSTPLTDSNPLHARNPRRRAPVTIMVPGPYCDRERLRLAARTPFDSFPPVILLSHGSGVAGLGYALFRFFRICRRAER